MNQCAFSHRALQLRPNPVEVDPQRLSELRQWPRKSRATVEYGPGDAEHETTDVKGAILDALPIPYRQSARN